MQEFMEQQATFYKSTREMWLFCFFRTATMASVEGIVAVLFLRGRHKSRIDIIEDTIVMFKEKMYEKTCRNFGI